jgi:hypothetical protein
MVIREHAYKRYVLRVLGITDEKEIKQCIVANKPKLTEDINKLKDESIFIWSGAIGDQTVKNFYLNNNIALVCSVEDGSLITLFDIDYGFPRDINNNIIEGLLSKLCCTNKDIEKKRLEIEAELPKIQSTVLGIEEQIKILEQQLDILKWKKTHAEDSITNLNKELDNLNLHKEKLAKQLLCSLNYKVEFLGNKVNGNN